jgi:hypothetical protein
MYCELEVRCENDVEDKTICDRSFVEVRLDRNLSVIATEEVAELESKSEG